MSITDRSAKAMKLSYGKSTVSLTDENLILQLRGGTKTWRYRYTQHDCKKRVTLNLGRYPALSVAKAYEKRSDLDTMHAQGHDPKEEQARQEHEALTISWLINEFITKDIRRNRKQPWHPELLLNTHVFPIIGDVLLTKLTTQHITKLLDNITVTGHRVTSNKVLSIVKQMLSYAVVRGYLLNNVTVELKQRHAGGKESPRDRNLSFKELKQFWCYLDNNSQHRINLNVIVAIKLLITTGQRTSDILNADWDEFDFDNKLWTIPKTRYKTGIDHKVNITPVMLELLKVLEPKCTNNPQIGRLFNLGRSVMLSVIKRAYRPVADGTVRVNIAPFTAHDLRRTCASRMSDLKVDAIVIEKILGHSLPKILASYNKGEMLSERKEALMIWQQAIMNLVNNKNVVHLKQCIS